MAKKVHVKQEQNETRKLVKELTERIKAERINDVGTFEKQEGMYVVKRKYNGKKVSKVNFRQLRGLCNFLRENPKMKDEEVRAMLHKKSFEFGFLITCDRNIEDFFSELRRHGAESIAVQIENSADVMINY